MKYECLCLSVKDMEVSKRFYIELLGLEIETDWGVNVSFKGGIALQQGFDQIVGVPVDSIVSHSHNMELVFETDDFEEFVTRAKSYPNIEFVRGDVIEQPWGQRVLHMYDPNGHIIEVGEKFEQVVLRFRSSGMSIEAVSKRLEIPVSDVEKYLKGLY